MDSPVTETAAEAKASPMKRRNCADAVAAIQYKLRAIKKDASALGYKYLTLPSLLDQIYEVAGKMGVSFTFNMACIDPTQQLFETTATMIYIDTNEKLTASAFGVIRQEDIPVSKAGNKSMSYPQWIGACNSYFRRYAMLNLIGIAPDEDTDLAARV